MHFLESDLCKIALSAALRFGYTSIHFAKSALQLFLHLDDL